LNYQLKQVLWSDEALALIPDFGWNDGGCRSLMKAFLLWLGRDELRTYQIVKTPEQHHSEHAFVQVGPWFLDGDGVSGFAQMKYRWQFEERLPDVVIREFNPETEPDHVNGDQPFYIEDDRIHALVRLLDQHVDKDELLEVLKV
jgi:hypothetical protein